ncbi:putative major facilitator, sugar transporter, major facilitator superfamily [Medicago truncatula]|uniref:Putative major facilitator, sugar transporter, major facilitator superfamily n=1 Tax=Medicago truncatula TaxID=3880 RepID=A0A396IVY7_MEDTR|nr:putative major facilitator, sugar transporter, major facilitator superfamily [Medicago truncatula]
MKPFLKKLFPYILRNAAGTKVNMYCVYDSQILTLFTSSLYLAGFVSSLVASKATTMFGRRNVIIIGGIVFLAGGAINGGSENIHMLIFGRALLGLGVGFTNQVSQWILNKFGTASVLNLGNR